MHKTPKLCITDDNSSFYYEISLVKYNLHIIYTDINECDGVNECQQHCHNTIGSYNCSCDVGFTLNRDERNCTGIYAPILYQT